MWPVAPSGIFRRNFPELTQLIFHLDSEDTHRYENFSEISRIVNLFNLCETYMFFVYRMPPGGYITVMWKLIMKMENFFHSPQSVLHVLVREGKFCCTSHASWRNKWKVPVWKWGIVLHIHIHTLKLLLVVYEITRYFCFPLDRDFVHILKVKMQNQLGEERKKLQ